jgi:hypothetical protein
MITFSKYTDIVQSISKKLKVSKDQAVNALIKAQQKGIDPLKWQKHITMLKQFVQIVAHKEDTQKEFFTLGVNKPTKDQIQDYLDRLGNAVRLLSNKDIIRTVERYFKTIKNLKLDRSGRKVLAFEELETEERDYKDEYKKFQSSPERIKYRSELNRYNRKKGTYGNGDKLDASHKGRKIIGMEDQSINRGRAEKSRLVGSKRAKTEEIKVPIKVGDVVLGGKFKNKKVTVKKIGKNEKGDITINDRPLLKYRIPKTDD